MAARRPIFTENFSKNLADIESFLAEGRASEFVRLFDEIVEKVVPDLCEFPKLGRSFLTRSIHSTQAQQRAAELSRYLDEDDDLRELIHDQYLILYLSRGDEINFLSIKHHKQLSFDLGLFWRD